MIKKIMATSVVVGSMFAFVGCGSDNDTPVVAAVETGTSYYIDSAVSGVNYTCGSQEGITGADGSFTFEVGSSCTFYLGDIELRSVAVEELVDGENVVETDVAIARILQSLDSDGNPDNGITIDAEIIEAMVEAGITSLPVTVEELIVFEEVLIANELILVNIADAQEHLDETRLTLLLAGKTFYNVGFGWIDRIVFNADVTSITWEQVVGDNVGITGTDTLLIVDGQLAVTSGEDGNTFNAVLGEETTDYLLFNILDSNGVVAETNRFYFEEAKAETYYASLNGYIVITEAMLSGKTFYDTFTDSNGPCYAKMTFSTTSGTRHEICYDSYNSVIVDSTFTFDIALINGKIRADTPDEYKWFTLMSEDATAWYMINDDDVGKDGTLDKVGERNTWYLSEPAGFPSL